jgi:cysteinyl-tRNA synthetase
MRQLSIYNTISKSKETFKPLHDGLVGMYVCGPTVYSNVHLGNIRTFTSFDVIYRYLLYVGYKVRYVRNITDVGHLVGDVDEGEDKIAVRAKLENLEPMEVVQKYTNGFHEMMSRFNTLPPSLEPRATGHIIEQIEMVQRIIDNGFAYESNGSVYFSVPAFTAKHDSYGQVSGKVLDDLLTETRDLKNQDEKKHPADFAIWMKADERHLMRWNSPWSVGFPGWHLECSAMSTKYLGEKFDIHGGGADLKFPHHENEVAQNMGSCGCTPANIWMHTNMLLLNGKKMSKSDGNSIMPEELFSGESPHISKAYSPMTVKFFMLQAHYRSTLDLSDEALLAAEKGYKRLMEAHQYVKKITDHTGGSGGDIDKTVMDTIDQAFSEMDDDFNTPKALARLFELVTIVNSHKDGRAEFVLMTNTTIAALKNAFDSILTDIMGLLDESESGSDAKSKSLDAAMALILELRQEARASKNWAMSDKIRDSLAAANITIKDGKEGSTWSLN